MTPEEMRAYIEAAPLPGDGPPIYERGLPDGIVEGEETAYSWAARSLAHALLVLVDDQPELLEVPSREDDPSGFEAADNRALWDAFTEHWPDGNAWLGGPTGFQYGWAHNAVRYVAGVDDLADAGDDGRDPGERPLEPRACELVRRANEVVCVP